MDSRRLYQPAVPSRLLPLRSRMASILALSGGRLATGSLYLFANALTQAVFGVVFWTIAARAYSLASVGFASAIVSTAGLVVTLSNLGLGSVVVRYLGVSGAQARKLCIVATLGAAAAATLIVAGGIAFPFWPLAAQIIAAGPSGFALPGLLAVAMSIIFVQDNIFIARHRTPVVFGRGVVAALVRFALLFIMAGAGANGLLLAFTAGAMVSVALGSGAWSGKSVGDDGARPAEKIGPVEMARFGSTAYISGLFSQAPQLLYPALIASQVSHDAAGAFTFAWMAAALLMQLPPSVASVLMAQLVRDPAHAAARIRQITRIMVATIAITGLFVGMGVMLFTALFLPSAKVEVVRYLPLLLASSLPYTLVRMRTMELSLRGDLRSMLALNLVVALVAFVLPALLLPIYGVVGLEIGWAASQAAGAVMTWVGAREDSRRMRDVE